MRPSVALFRAPPKVMLVAQADNNNGATSPTFTTYRKGDLLVAFAGANSSAVVPTLPSGWTQIDTNSGNSCGAITAYRFAATDGADTLGTWTNANGKSYRAFRNVDRISPIGGHALNNGASASTVAHPAITQARQYHNHMLTWVMTRANNAGQRSGTTTDYQSTSGLRARTAPATTNPLTATWATDSPANDTGNTSGHNVAAIEICGKRRI